MIPHLAVPFRIVGARAQVVEQDTLDEVAQNVKVILGSTPGERLAAPEFGLPDPTFLTGLDTAEIDAVISRWEPRAQVTLARPEVSDAGEYDLVLHVALEEAV